MSNQIREAHQVLMTKLRYINEFIQTNYLRNTRRKVSDLADELDITIDELVDLMNVWLRNTIREESAKANIIYKLGLFFSESHKRPKIFSKIDFSSRERYRMQLASQQLELPGYTHVSLFREMMLADDAGKKNIAAQIYQAWDVTNQALIDNGFIEKTTEIKFDFNPETQLKPWDNSTPVNYGISVSSSGNEDVGIVMQWGRHTYAMHDKLISVDPAEYNLICLTPENQTPEKRKERLHHTANLNAFVLDMASKGMFLSKVHCLSNPLTDKVQRPLLGFINKGDAMVEMIITFKKIENVGKFILN